MQVIDVALPGQVWEDYLDPAASGMQAELGLREPVRRNMGRGWRAIYRDVPLEAAEELAGYLRDRGQTLLNGASGESDQARAILRAGIQSAERIDDDVRRAREAQAREAKGAT